MKKSKVLKWKLTVSLVCLALLVFAGVVSAQTTISVLGANAPIPGPNDVYQTNFVAAKVGSPPPGGGAFDYYVDHDPAPGQTFTTGSNTAGYSLTSLALYDGDDTGGGFGTETFTLNIYTISGTTATVYATYVSQSITLIDFQWFQWTNLGAILQPNTQYAYAMYANGSGWMNLGNTNVAFSGGQVAAVPRAGGTMSFSTSNNWNGDFDLGLAPITAVTVTQPVFSTGPNVFPGTSLTASAQVAGPTPYFYQWQTDGGSGGSLTNIPGATGATLPINTTGFTPGNYQYALAVSNNTSKATSAPAILSVVQLVGIPGVIGIKFGFSGGYATSVNLAQADQAGVPSGPLVPPQYQPLTAVMNWNNLLPTSPAGADTNIWSIAQDSAGNALSGVTLTAAGIDDGWYNNFSDCPDARLLDSFWKFNTSNGQADAGGKFYATFTIANLPRSTYDVYAYIDDNNNNYWGNVQANSVLALGKNIDSDGFNGAESDPCSLSTPLHTAAGFGNPANYVKMPFVTTNAGGVITVTVVMIGGGDFGISGIELVPSPDVILTQDILPTYSQTVVGDQVVFKASFGNSPAANLQWKDISGGVTNNINTGVVNVTNNGVVTSTLTLNNVQLNNSGSYQLEAINATNSVDIAYTAVASLSVSNSPAAVNNVIVNYAEQTGQNLTNAWTINTNIDLIYGFPTTGGGPGTATAGAGNFGQDLGNIDPTILANTTNVGDLSSDFVACGFSGTGASMTYTLNTQTYGYDITNITVYGGWINGGRIEQLYQVLYSTVSAPGTFVPLLTADYKPTDSTGAPTSSRTTLVPVNGILLRNIYAVEINWQVGSPQNNYCGYSAISMGGAPSSQIYTQPPVLTQDITPLTAEDVAGSQLIVTAGFTNATSYQWQKNGTNINGANATTLTLNNLQPTDAGAYSLVASNAGGMFASRACAVTVDPAPTAVGNTITAFAYQTADEAPFGPTWETNSLSSSLIYLQNPPSGGNGAGDFTGGGDHAGGLAVLTDGGYGLIDFTGATHPAFAAGGPNAGQYVIYNLGGNTNGYSVTNIQIAGGWNDNGRNSQFYTVSYSTVSNPSNFIPIKAVNNSPSFSHASAIRTTITPATGVLAANAYAIEVDFTTPSGVPNGYSGYSEISVFGSPTVAQTLPVFAGPKLSGGNLILTGTGGTPNASYTWLSTTNLSAPIIWTTNSTGTLDGTGAFSNAIPIGASRASFFRFRMP